MSDDKARALMLPDASRSLARLQPVLSDPPTTWSRKSIKALKKQTQRAEQANAYLRTRVIEAIAIRALAESRIRAGLAMTDLAALREICSAHFLKGRRQRASDVLVHDLECRAKETHARVSLAIAQRHEATFPPPEPPASASPHRSADALSPEQVDEIVASLPEVSDATRATLLELLKGRLEEDAS